MCKQTPSKGVGGKGWGGDKTWKSNVETVRNITDIKTINGQVVSQYDATRLINAANGTIFRGPEISATGSHIYWHLHYYIDGIKHTIQVLP